MFFHREQLGLGNLNQSSSRVAFRILAMDRLFTRTRKKSKGASDSPIRIRILYFPCSFTCPVWFTLPAGLDEYSSLI